MFVQNRNIAKNHQLAVIVSITLMITSIVTVTAQMYKKTDVIQFDREFAFNEANKELLTKSLFKETFLSIYDKNFMQHSGFVLVEDFLSTYKIRPSNQLHYGTIHRALASRVEAPGFLGRVYQNYLIPIRLEREFSKDELLLYFVHILEKMSGETYLSIIENYRKNADLNVYDWALIHAIHQASYSNMLSLDGIEGLFFDALNKMYASGLIADDQIDSINDKHRAKFLTDIYPFINVSQTVPQQSQIIERNSIRQSWPRGLGGAVRWADLVAFYAEKHDIDFAFFMAIIQAESNGDPNAVSHANAYGLGQVLLPTARFVTGNPRLSVQQLFDPNTNLDISARYIRLNINRVKGEFPGLSEQQVRTLVAASYNAGWGRVKRLGRVPHIEETQNYVKRVERFYLLYSDNESFIRNNIAMN
jgi:hypothetical protein